MSFVKSSSSADGREVYKRTRTKLPPMRRSLSILLVSLQGSTVVIELKSDVEVSGVVVDADVTMKVTLSEVKQVRPDGTVSHSDFMVIEGAAIRYVHIPRSINMRSLLSDYVRKTDRIKGQNQPHKIRTKEEDFSAKQDIVLNALDD